MLHEFLNSQRKALIERCREKVSQRFSPPASEMELQHGLPLFLDQLIEALRHDEASISAHDELIGRFPPYAPGSVPGDRDAALHGAELSRLGYTVDQVVHDYGDLCQAITELAKETNAPVTINEFHTLNRLLDNAMANAVSAYGRAREVPAFDERSQALHERLGTLAEEERRLVGIALTAFDAIKTGNVGVGGATGALLEDSLLRLRALIDRSLPEVRVDSGMVG